MRARAEERSAMTVLRRWLARALAAPERFPEEFRTERLDQPYPLPRPVVWYEVQEVGLVRYEGR
jgi:hypothetical protein